MVGQLNGLRCDKFDRHLLVLLDEKQAIDKSMFSSPETMTKFSQLKAEMKQRVHGTFTFFFKENYIG